MATGKKAASEAGKVLADPKATKAEKAAAASDLAQAPKKTQIVAEAGRGFRRPSARLGHHAILPLFLLTE